MKKRLAVFLLALLGIAADPPITAVAISPDGKSVVAGSQTGIAIRSWPELVPVRSLATELAHINDFAFSPNGSTLAAAGGRPGERGRVELFDWPAGKQVRRIDLAREIINGIAWRSDNTGIAAAGGDGVIYLCDKNGTQPPRKLTGHSRGVQAVLYLPGDGELMSAGLDDSVRLWDVKTSAVLQNLAQHTRPALGLSIRPGGGEPLVASIGGDRTVRFWQPARGRMMRFARLPSVPTALAWTADGKSVVTACHDGRVRVVDPESAEVRLEVPAINGVAHCMAVATDGSIAVGGEGGQIILVPNLRLGTQ